MSGKEPEKKRKIVWDTEQRHELEDAEGRIRGTTMFISMPLLAQMEKRFGVFTSIRTGTDQETGEVRVGKAGSEEIPGAVPVRRTGSHNVAHFSFWVPLRKLGIKVPKHRQFNVTPFVEEGEDGPVFVFPMTKRVSVPRNIKQTPDVEVAAAEEEE